ncbi:hypothetical protein HS088_TW15G00915 [Tripterygium wilfordii]|uniref:Uncharacterized protein n=1 Tax=Tripterygium wilfordii TaxID=458696 RepID=A0A7J7CMW1_TRIWF|nr:uncharacterized protein LOC120017219 [Tripterygium wilfordii]KAF5735413.1 hypothetical protein HS088_TW15G00915 [Tripterygium wilfordii]
MDSSSATLSFPATKTLSSLRTASFSSFSSSFSSSSSSYYFPDDQSPINPSTPLRFSGVPFSWEQLPGIPKKAQNHHHMIKDVSSMPIVLPLPPPTTSKRFDSEEFGISKKVGNSPSDWRDPFFAALVKCSKEDHHRHHQSSTDNSWIDDGPKVSRSVSDRFGFGNLYTSCKRSCNVTESIIYVNPRSRRTSYDPINHHRPN